MSMVATEIAELRIVDTELAKNVAVSDEGAPQALYSEDKILIARRLPNLRSGIGEHPLQVVDFNIYINNPPKL